jgi:hypothetical protein
MSKLLEELKYDLGFVKTHTLQPKWYKVLKVFILLGVLVGLWLLLGWARTVVFFTVFILLSFLLHMLYRIKTNKYTRSWMDFKVVTENNEIKAKSIGLFYYSAIMFNAAIALVISLIILPR